MLIRWGIKLGLAGGAVYYISEQGIWKDASHSEKICKSIKEKLEPHVTEIKAKLPFDIPSLPKSEKFSYTAAHYWNAGVMWTFNQMANLPTNLNKWTNKGIENAKANPEFKKFLDSFSENKTEQISQGNK